MQELQKPKQGYKLLKSYFGKYEEIPEEWELRQISELGNVIGGGTPDSGNKKYWDGNIPWAVPTDITNQRGIFIDRTERQITQEGLDNSSAKLLPAGTLLITSRATIGECAISTVPIATNQGFQSLICNSENDNLFLFYAIKFHRNRLLRLCYGTTFPEISKNNIKQVKLPCPPLKEQQKIATILSRVDGLIQKTDQIIEQTQRLKEGLMQRLLTQGIAHSSFKKTDAGRIPEGWQVMELGKVLNMCQYGLSLKLSERGQYPTFRMNNIENGYMVTNEMKFLDLDKATFGRHKLEKGDLLFNRTNSSDLVGKIGLFTLDGDYTFASYLIRIRPNRGIINPFFLNYYLNTDFMQYKLKSLATPGVGQVNINAENLKSISIPIPTITEQEKIVSILQKIDEQKHIITGIREYLLNLKKGLMQKLLTGKIRVKV